MSTEKRLAQKRLAQRNWRARNPDKVQEKNRSAKEKARLNLWRQYNVSKTNEIARRYRRNIRQRAMAKLGGLCANCGFSNFLALEFDHIEPLHGKHRDPQARVAKLINEGSADFQILCANCNAIKEQESR